MIMMYIDDVIFTSANIIVGLCRCVCVCGIAMNV